MSVYVPSAVRRSIRADVEENVSDSWYHYGAEQVALRAYRQGVRDERAKNGPSEVEPCSVCGEPSRATICDDCAMNRPEGGNGHA